MGRPPHTDRNTVSFKHLGLRMNRYEYETLMELVAMKNREMQKAGFPPAFNATTLLKLLVRQEAERCGVAPQRSSLDEEEDVSETVAVDEFATAAKQASPRRAPLSRRLPPADRSDGAVPIMDAEVAKRVLAVAAGDDRRRPVPRPGSRRRRKQT